MKNGKEFRIYCPGKFPQSRKERNEFYRLMERMGIMKLIFGSFENKEIIVRGVK